MSGLCRARLTAVGADSYVSRLTLEAKQAKKPQTSEMMRSLQSLVKWIGVIVIPLGVIMFIKEFIWLGRDIPVAVTSTVGSIIGMIPEGLYLLTSLTLVHELDCIETLARVDTLCVDKTGTVTENKMIVEDVHLLCEDRFALDDIRMIMSDYVYAMQADNDTMAALRRYFTGEVTQQAIAALPFSSAKKYGGVSFHEDETYLLGAPDVLLAGRENPYAEQIEAFSAKGCRVLLLGMYDGSLEDETLSADLLPLALILLSNKIRAEAPETFGYFARQGVAVKVISGDNALTVSEVAKRAGIENADKFVDARTLTSDEMIREAAGQYTVFGRVTPAQKRKLVRKEARIGLTNGAILGAASFVLIGAYLLLRAEAPLMAFGVSGCIGIALVAAMLLSSVSGTVIPIFFKKIGVDPAVASGPLITTVNDLVAVVSYYGLTWLLLIEWLRLT